MSRVVLDSLGCMVKWTESMANKKIQTAVIPCAGYGTRLFPVTKSVPKELLPIVSTPAIQYVVEELVSVGISEIVLVTNSYKMSIEDYFLPNNQLNAFLSDRHKNDELRQLNDIQNMVKISVVNQPEPKGLGDAVLCAENCIRDQFFVVALPDVIFPKESKSTARLLNQCKENECGGLLLKEFLPQNSKQYGVVKAQSIDDGVYCIKRAVEKPAPDEAPSNLGIIGRYVLSKEVFSQLKRTAVSKSGEVELTSVLDNTAEKDKFLGVLVDGPLFDVGTIDGYVAATNHFFQKGKS